MNGSLQAVRVTGYFSAVPVHLQAGLTITHMLIRGSPWQPPPLTGMVGYRPEAPGKRVTILANETPISLLPSLTPITKSQLEQIHLDKFCTDWWTARRERLYSEVRRGPAEDQPPDFVGNTPTDANVGIDCAQFAIQNRRLANAQFEAIKQAVMSTEAGEFSHLSGLLVYVWVHGDAGPQLPLREKERHELLIQLGQFRYQPGAGETSGTYMPQQAPDLGITTTPVGWRFYATPILGSAPASLFFLRTGFEMAFVYASEHTSSAGWSDFDRRVVDHDKPAIRDLVVTIGGADRFGYIHPSEETIFDQMLDTPAPSYTPQHLRRVFAHGWGTGRIIQVYPELEVVAPGVFQGAVPSHQQLATS
jgi:hypothetical protein